ncbi:TetR/AcrR family transcriptional regulator [Jannaschia formosa]|uniref:TetR/AcrR family transcriptional regulator n=1 Tax=Jannaschia formosa TaxID=2259592 RepID=UPI00142FA631|nr:TetR/AcrR family transcriptional regulator [Jannaschia formosa]
MGISFCRLPSARCRIIGRLSVLGSESMPKVAPEAMQERRAQIVAAAMRVFAEKGLSRATLRDVFREAGLSAGAVYNYFQSKDDIILAVTEAGMGDALSAFDAQGADGRRLEEVIDYFFTELQGLANTPVPRVDIMIVTEALANDDVRRSVLKNRAAIKAALVRLVERKQASEPSWQAHPAPVLADLIYTTYQGLVMSLALGEEVDLPAFGTALKMMRFG